MYKKLIALVCLSSLTACGVGSGYRPIVDGKNANYESDLSACQGLGAQRGYMNDDSKIETGLSAGAGALGGAVIGSNSGNAGAGALAGLGVGLIAGAIGSSMKDKEEQKSIVINCMRGRGHKVIEDNPRRAARY
jgi:hypothetical protein